MMMNKNIQNMKGRNSYSYFFISIDIKQRKYIICVLNKKNNTKQINLGNYGNKKI